MKDDSKLAIMQPYLFPYIGYFQLVSAVDLFIFYNDVNFIKRGWINRNRILVNGKEYLFTIPVQNSSQNVRICDTRIVQDSNVYKKLLQTIEFAYGKAPYFHDIMSLIYSIFNPLPEYINQLSENSIRLFSKYFKLDTKFKSSCGLYGNENLLKDDRLIDICRQEGVKNYVNAPGGQSIYTKEYFSKSGVSLYFLDPIDHNYKQLSNSYTPNLSIIDIAMCNDRESVNYFMSNYNLK